MPEEQPTEPRKSRTEDVRTPEEVRISNLLVELQAHMPPSTIIIPLPDQLARGIPVAVEKWVRPFAGHPERISWLRDFVSKVKETMIDALPQGVGVDVLTDKNAPSSSPKFTKWQFFHNNNPLASKAISDAGRVISRDFSRKFESYKK